MVLPLEKSPTPVTMMTRAATATPMRLLADFPTNTTVSEATCKSCRTRTADRYVSPPPKLGATHDITAAKKRIFDAVWPTGLWVFADKGYKVAGSRVKTPLKEKQPKP